MTTLKLPENQSFKIINILSFAIPLAVGVLLGIPSGYKLPLGEWTKILPTVSASINSLTSILLIMAFIAIKNKNITLHKTLMTTCFGLGALFLVSYILYHVSNQSTKYGGEGFLKGLYFFFLISHILLSIVVVRFVLMSMYFAYIGDFENHKKNTRFAFPIWLYVSITGVIVYFMIKPFYV